MRSGINARVRFNVCTCLKSLLFIFTIHTHIHHAIHIYYTLYRYTKKNTCSNVTFQNSSLFSMDRRKLTSTQVFHVLWQGLRRDKILYEQYNIIVDFSLSPWYGRFQKKIIIWYVVSNARRLQHFISCW